MASDDLKAFSKKMKKLALQIESGSAAIQEGAAEHLSKNLTMEVTPVKTGQARNNWLLSVGTPDTRIVKDDSFDLTGTARHDKNKYWIGKHKPGQDIYISNNLPYIKRLNEGWSKQAPAAFVEAAIQRTNEFLKRVKILVKGDKRGQ